MLGPFLGGLIADNLGYRATFWVTGGLLFVAGVLTFAPIGITIWAIAWIIQRLDSLLEQFSNLRVVYHYRQQGLPWLKAAVRGTREIAMPVTFSVMTNMVAFFPMFFVPGILGKVFKQIPVVVISVFAISLIECFFILPAHVGHQKPSKKGFFTWIYVRQQRFSKGFIRLVVHRYGPLLELALRWRYVTVSLGIAILLITVGYVKSGRLGFELFPKIESDYAMVTATLPFGSAFEKTEKVQQILVRAAQEVVAENGGKALMEGIFANINDNTAEVRIYLTPPDKRPVSTAQITERWRERVGVIPGLESILFESDAGGPGRGPVLSVELSHKDIGILEKAAADVADALGFFPIVKDIDDGFAPGKQQIDFRIKPEARSLGLRSKEVARQVRHAYYGAEALRQQRGRNEVKVMVRLPKEERISEYNLEEMILRTPAGNEIPLRNAVTIHRGRAYTDINRRDGRRIVTVTADVRPRSKADEVLQSLKAETLPKLQNRYPGLTYSFEGRQADRRESIQSLVRGLLVALVIIFAMLAVPLNSYIQPFIIMSAIPFGIVGAVIGHLVMGYSLSVLSMFGVVALSGVVVNDSLVLIDFANRKERAGMSRRDAVHQAGIHRFRPIILTTLTTFGGLSPMIFETSRQARFLIPMALSLGFGILFATMITLVLVPSLYLIVEDIRQLIKVKSSSDTKVRQEDGPQF